MVVILYNIRSLYNVGSVFRTADALGVEKIYICGITPGPLDIFNKSRPQLSKVSLGAEKSVAWDNSIKSLQALLKLIEKLKKQGYKIFAVEQDKKSTPYFKAKIKSKKQKTALILGNEIKGLPLSILKKADKILEIPMEGKKESLNVAIAFSIVAFHLKYSNMK